MEENNVIWKWKLDKEKRSWNLQAGDFTEKRWELAKNLICKQNENGTQLAYISKTRFLNHWTSLMVFLDNVETSYNVQMY